MPHTVLSVLKVQTQCFSGCCKKIRIFTDAVITLNSWNLSVWADSVLPCAPQEAVCETRQVTPWHCTRSCTKVYLGLVATVFLKITVENSDIRKKEGANQDFMSCSSINPQYGNVSNNIQKKLQSVDNYNN